MSAKKSNSNRSKQMKKMNLEEEEEEETRGSPQNTPMNIVYLNSLGSRKMNIYTVSSLRTSSLLAEKPRTMDSIGKVLESGVPLSSEYIQKIKEYLSINQTRVGKKLYVDLSKREADDEYYKNYVPQNPKVNIISNMLKKQVLAELANVPKEVATEEVEDAFRRVKLAEINEKQESVEAQLESGLIKEPIVVIEPITPPPYFEGLGHYTELLNDLFNTYDFKVEEINRVYKWIGKSQEKAEKFILDQEARTPGYSRKKLAPVSSATLALSPIMRPIFSPSPASPVPSLDLDPMITPTDPEVEAEVLAQEEEMVKEEGGEQEVKDDSLLPVAKNIIINNIPKDRYHPIEIEWFFGSKDVPDWDTVLERQVISSNLKPSEIKEKMKLILESSGPKMGINKNISDTLEELNELQQIHFCILRSLNRGVRYRTVTVKESDMLALKQSAKTLPDDPEVGVEVQAPSSKPQDTFSDSIILSVAEEDAKFQKAYNNRLFDNSGRSVAAFGDINTTKTVYSGNENASLHRPSNLLDSFSRPGAPVIHNHQRKGR
jgi:hypothetical protein